MHRFIGKCEGVLLDVDGTLVDSNHQHALAWIDALVRNGFSFPYEKVRSLVGMGGDKIIPLLCNLEPESELAKQILIDRAEVFIQTYLEQIKPFPRVHSLIESFIEQGSKIAIASSADPKELTKILEHTGLRYLCPLIVPAEESKPDPNVLIAALRKLQLQTHNTIMIGDTPYDSKASSKIHLPFVGVTSGGWKEEDLQPAVFVYEDVSDICDNFESSPFFNAKNISKDNLVASQQI